MVAHRLFAEYVKRDLIMISGRLPNASWIPISIPLGLKCHTVAPAARHKAAIFLCVAVCILLIK